MKTNKLMDEIRKSTPADTNKQVDLCVAIANRVFELLQERNMKQRDFAKALGKTETEVSRWLSWIISWIPCAVAHCMGSFSFCCNCA